METATVDDFWTKRLTYSSVGIFSNVLITINTAPYMWYCEPNFIFGFKWKNMGSFASFIALYKNFAQNVFLRNFIFLLSRRPFFSRINRSCLSKSQKRNKQIAKMFFSQIFAYSQISVLRMFNAKKIEVKNWKRPFRPKLSRVVGRRMKWV